MNKKRKIIEIIHNPQTQIFEKKSKIDKILARLSKKKLKVKLSESKMKDGTLLSTLQRQKYL
jgi:hypothetical protein